MSVKFTEVEIYRIEWKMPDKKWVPTDEEDEIPDKYKNNLRNVKKEYGIYGFTCYGTAIQAFKDTRRRSPFNHFRLVTVYLLIVPFDEDLKLRFQKTRAVITDSVTLVLTFYWYDEIASGRKRIEYRDLCEYWKNRIWDRRDELKFVTFSRGYTKTRLKFKIDSIDRGDCPYEQWPGEYYRIHFTEEVV